MTLSFDLPPEVTDAFGDELERKVLEGLLLQLVQGEQMSVAKAGSLLGLNRLEAIRWYTSHGFAFPNYSADDFMANDLSYAKKD